LAPLAALRALALLPAMARCNARIEGAERAGVGLGASGRAENERRRSGEDCNWRQAVGAGGRSYYATA
jgi:hypothetical protein